MTFLKGPNRWVTKCPQHLEQLPVVHRTFPDATIVITHRDPVASIQSAITMSCYAARVLRKRVDPAGDAEYWIDRYERLLRRCVRDRDTLPSRGPGCLFPRTDGRHRRGAQADLRQGRPAAHGCCAARTCTVSSPRIPRGKYGQVQYNLRRDFGMEPAAIRERFQFYWTVSRCGSKSSNPHQPDPTGVGHELEHDLKRRARPSRTRSSRPSTVRGRWWRALLMAPEPSSPNSWPPAA